MMNLAIFPLPLVLFPGGVTRLRIFEQRYLRMVKEASGDTGFALTPFTPHLPNHISDRGSWVKITDFETLDDGLLGIEIQAQCVLTINTVIVEHDNLSRGQTTPAQHWPQQPHTRQTLLLADQLKQLFATTAELNALYPQPCYDNANWVCLRWLEILPIEATEKAHFFDPGSFALAADFLSRVNK
jgi:Lon protease-like protein